MRNYRFCAVLVAVAISIGLPAAAQWQVGPVYPQNEQRPYIGNPPPSSRNYNPFRYNAHSGRFDYVPIPYEPQRPGPNYHPFPFNWHSGRWDYVPWGPPFDYNEWAREGPGDWGTASNYRDTRLYPRPSLELQSTPDGASTTEPTAAPERRPPAPPMPAMIIPQATTRRAPATTRAASHPATAPATPNGWVRMRGIVGRWEYDYASGRWIFVLPSD
jgi:hypothetical protein